jgi:mono/diheme cytochrome c family protein
MKMIQKATFTGAIIAGGMALAMVTGTPANGEAGISSVAKIDAEELWREECASCHGRDGKGETRAGKRAGAPDMTKAEFHESASDEQAFKSVKEGIIDEKGAERKKPFGEHLTDEQIEALVEYLRKFDPKHPRDLSEAALKKK